MKKIVLVLLACTMASCASKEKEMGREPSQVTGGVSKAESMALTAQDPHEETRQERRERQREEHREEHREERRQQSPQGVTEKFYGEIQRRCQNGASSDKAFTLKILNSAMYHAYKAVGARDVIEQKQLVSASFKMARSAGLEELDAATGEARLKPICSYSGSDLKNFLEEVSDKMVRGHIPTLIFYEKISKDGIRD